VTLSRCKHIQSGDSIFQAGNGRKVSKSQAQSGQAT